MVCNIRLLRLVLRCDSLFYRNDVHPKIFIQRGVVLLTTDSRS